MSGYPNIKMTATFKATTANTRSKTKTAPFGVIEKRPMRLAAFPGTMNIGVIRHHYSIFGRSV